MAQARRTLSGLLRKGKEALREKDADEATLTAKQVPKQATRCFEKLPCAGPAGLPGVHSSPQPAPVMGHAAPLWWPRWPARCTFQFTTGDGICRLITLRLQALDVARELTDKRAERAVLRLLARALRMVPSFFSPCVLLNVLMHFIHIHPILQRVLSLIPCSCWSSAS